MKKYICGICSLIIFFLALGIPMNSVCAIEKVTVAGGEVLPEQQQMEPVDEIATQSVQIAEYVLPFPGMLPDNPLYFLKRIRDTILEKLINDPVRKAEFYILQSDKRLQMGVMLIEQGKGSLGETNRKKVFRHLNRKLHGLWEISSQITQHALQHSVQILPWLFREKPYQSKPVPVTTNGIIGPSGIRHHTL